MQHQPVIPFTRLKAAYIRETKFRVHLHYLLYSVTRSQSNLSGKLTNYKLLLLDIYKLVEENRVCNNVLCLRDGWVLNIAGSGHGVVLSHSHVCS